MGTASYDGMWTLTAEGTPGAADDGVLLGNGQLGVLAHPTQPRAWACAGDGGQLIELFDFLGWDVGGGDAQVQRRQLNLFNAVYSTALEAPSGGLQVETSLYVPQHLPYCVVQTLKLGGAAVQGLQVRHRVRARPPMASGLRIHSNLIHLGAAGTSAYVLTVEASHAGTAVAAATCSTPAPSPTGAAAWTPTAPWRTTCSSCSRPWGPAPLRAFTPSPASSRTGTSRTPWPRADAWC